VLRGLGLEDRALPFADVAGAYRHACDMAGDDDRIAAFGSFYTVADVLRATQPAHMANPSVNDEELQLKQRAGVAVGALVTLCSLRWC
jgi:hypothetical protein